MLVDEQQAVELTGAQPRDAARDLCVDVRRFV
jgi:hypothetical protein